MPLSEICRTLLDDLLRNADTSALRAAAQDLSTRYRRKSSHAVRSDIEALAYLATRLPATYEAAAHVFHQIALRRPNFAPRRLLDVGAGPGTVTLAVQAQWPDLAEAALIEPNAHLAATGKKLLGHAVWRNDALQDVVLSVRGYDLVTAGYVLNEISGAIEPLVLKLWQATNDMLVLIEPGTPEGFGVILKARAALLAQGAHMVAPCSQAGTCPLEKEKTIRWCHFSARVPRSRLHRQIKDAELGYEDEKFSYLAVSRHPVDLPAFRLIGHPSGTKVRRLQVCAASGSVETVDIAKSHPAYKSVRKLEWGDSGDDTIFP